MSIKVQYTTPINIVQDNAETIATKKQFAKRQAFALLNTELADDTTYVIRTEATYTPSRPLFNGPDAPIVPGAGVFTYRITAIEWIAPTLVDWSNEQ